MIGPSAVCKSLRSTLINKYVPERITVNYEAYLQGAYAMTEAAIRLRYQISEEMQRHTNLMILKIYIALNLSLPV